MIKTVEFMGLNLTLAGVKEKLVLEKELGNQSPLGILMPVLAPFLSEAMSVEGEIDLSSIDLSKFQAIPLSVMLVILHASAQKLNSGVTMEKMEELVDAYLEQDGSVVELFGNIIISVLETGKYL